MRMHKQRLTKDDGRALIFYTFTEEAKGKPANDEQAIKNQKFASSASAGQALREAEGSKIENQAAAHV